MSKLIVPLILTLGFFGLSTQEELVVDKKTIEMSSSNPMTRPFTVYDFQMEIILVSAFLLYVLAWYQGKNENMKKAKYWLARHFEYFQSQYSLIGNEKSALVKDGPANYLLYVSGRRHVQFGHWWLKLKPRNDILTFFTTQLLALIGLAKPVADRVTVKLVLDKALPEKFAFAVIKQNESDELVKKRFDLSRFTKLGSSKVISNSFKIYTESQKLADIILSSKIGDILANHSDRLESLIISSLPSEEPVTYEADGALTVTLSFLMKYDTLDSLVQLSCELPDIIKDIKLPVDVKSHLNKNREALRKEYAKKVAIDRKEELAKKKSEAKRKEEERIKKMSPSEQRKWEEKEHARQLKKQMKRKKA